MENPFDPIDPMWFVVQNIIARREHRNSQEKLAKLWIRMNRKQMAMIMTTPIVPTKKAMICKSFLKDHGHCIICFISGCECYPLDLWKCIDESIGKIKKGEW